MRSAIDDPTLKRFRAALDRIYGERIERVVRFGSRVDLWVPRDAEILVSLGENVKGGSSVVAHWLGQPMAKAPGSARVAGANSNLAAAGKRA